MHVNLIRILIYILSKAQNLTKRLDEWSCLLVHFDFVVHIKLLNIINFQLTKTEIKLLSFQLLQLPLNHAHSART